MEISQIYVYPVKSLRGTALQSATLSKEGFVIDRKYMLMNVQRDKLENMHITHFPRMALFCTSIEGDNITINYHEPLGADTAKQTLKIPLRPSYEGLAEVPIEMHSSPTIGYDMGNKYGKWFSDIFGFNVRLIHWGGNARQVLGNLPGRKQNQPPPSNGLLSTLTSYVPVIGSWFRWENERIAFNDIAPFLVITEESLANAAGRLPQGHTLDPTKFRANLVLKGAPEAWDEDFWGILTINEGIKMTLTANCARCVSIIVDYTTGQSGTGDTATLLKSLMKDRRVDPGLKFAPVFGSDLAMLKRVVRMHRAILRVAYLKPERL
ncbi:uncharacterized protein PV06_11285 [Exophiala oligosperma]|uniref:MOSC domain-containing protein n=1 Tax=Exophiala oligosperma TaxID=215243 RepID=A0A0D2D2M2_9EURO|nr:uncharacterized protein PV06_11285 [Exophiala oligosperma]KIW36470.1 hypothetical protein PV06_11285 [Exophiala oligosperma]